MVRAFDIVSFVLLLSLATFSYATDSVTMLDAIRKDCKIPDAVSEQLNKDNIFSHCSNWNVIKNQKVIPQLLISDVPNTLCLLYYNSFISYCKTFDKDVELPPDNVNVNTSIGTICENLIQVSKDASWPKEFSQLFENQVMCGVLCSPYYNGTSICQRALYMGQETLKKNPVNPDNSKANADNTEAEKPAAQNEDKKSEPENQNVKPETVDNADQGQDSNKVKFPAPQNPAETPKIVESDKKSEFAAVNEHNENVKKSAGKPEVDVKKLKDDTILNPQNDEGVQDQPAKEIKADVAHEAENTNSLVAPVAENTNNLAAPPEKPTVTEDKPEKATEVKAKAEEDKRIAEKDNGQVNKGNVAKDLQDNQDVKITDGDDMKDTNNADILQYEGDIGLEEPVKTQIQAGDTQIVNDNLYVSKAKLAELDTYQAEMDGDSYFFSYFMVICIIFVFGYIVYHNKQKILALLIEGRQVKRHRGRRPNSANYHKLDSNLEEAISSSTCNKNTTPVIY